MTNQATRYGVIVADPPWRFTNVRTGGSLRSGSAQKYPTLSTGDICRIPVQEIAARNAALFLWATSSMLREGLEVFAAWGFRYTGTIVWSKTTRDGAPFNGLGYHFRNAAEFLLYGFRGKVPRLGCQIPNVVTAPVGRHSAKPEAVWRLIETAIDDREDLTPRLEMFCRGQPRPGWNGWGDECEGGVVVPTLAEALE